MYTTTCTLVCILLLVVLLLLEYVQCSMNFSVRSIYFYS